MGAMRTQRGLFVATALVTLAGCATTAPVPRPESFPPDATLVQVQNHGFADAVIYVLRSGVRMRLGLVVGNAGRTFTLPVGLPLDAPVQLVARPIAGTAYRLPPVNVSRGQQIELTVHSQQWMSNVSVWSR